MKLSEEARDIIEMSMRQNSVGDAEREDIERVVAALPDDRVLLYKNVVSNPVGDLYRYSIHIRLQHMLTFVTFLTLAFTGLPILFFDAIWSGPFNTLLGGVNVTRIIHRTIAVVMILTMIYHMFTITLGSLVRIRGGNFDIRRTMIPLWKDARDFREDIAYLPDVVHNGRRWTNLTTSRRFTILRPLLAI